VANLHLTYTRPQLDIFFPTEPVKYTIVAKGRRFGATRGAAHACMEWAAEGKRILWGDTINSNITRYWDRYFEPSLKHTGLKYHFDRTKNVASIGPGVIDFRSAEIPENWEGFGYHVIILNEAGIILKDPELYEKTVLPMLLDYPDSRLFAMGVPKGKLIKDGTDAPFWRLFSAEGPNRRSLRFSSYDNPLLSPDDIRDLEVEMAGRDPATVRQEIYGEFMDTVSGNPFAYTFDRAKHVGTTTPHPQDVHHFSIDFNVDPFVCLHARIWTDGKGEHFHTLGEIAIKEASVTAMAREILKVCPHRHLIRITGDRNGTARRIGLTDTTSVFEELRRQLGIGRTQMDIPANPPHLLSREEVNFVLMYHPDVLISPACSKLITDLTIVTVDANGSITKGDRSKISAQADALDCWRYLIHTRLRDWIKRKRNELHIGQNSGPHQPVQHRTDPARWAGATGL
jgi:hypothetical protein